MSVCVCVCGCVCVCVCVCGRERKRVLKRGTTIIGSNAVKILTGPFSLSMHSCFPSISPFLPFFFLLSSFYQKKFYFDGAAATAAAATYNPWLSLFLSLSLSLFLSFGGACCCLLLLLLRRYCSRESPKDLKGRARSKKKIKQKSAVRWCHQLGSVRPIFQFPFIRFDSS